MSFFANTHMHSTFSDGIYTPQELIKYGKKLGHKAMILTDHSTVNGLYHFQKEARKQNILTLNGIEFAANCSFGTAHIVGIDFDCENKEIRELISSDCDYVNALTKHRLEQGVKLGTIRSGLTYAEVEQTFCKNNFLCNNQVFELMVKKEIYLRSEYADFVKAFNSVPVSSNFPKNIAPSLNEVVSAIRSAGGVAVLAHPCDSEEEKYMDHSCLDEIISSGIMGIEVCHPIMSKEERTHYNNVCEKYNLYKLGGIDHSGLLGGYTKVMPNHDVGPQEGYIDEENFMKLYRRKLG